MSENCAVQKWLTHIHDDDWNGLPSTSGTQLNTAWVVVLNWKIEKQQLKVADSTIMRKWQGLFLNGCKWKGLSYMTRELLKLRHKWVKCINVLRGHKKWKAILQWNTSATLNVVITSHLLVMACGTLMIEGRSCTIHVKIEYLKLEMWWRCILWSGSSDEDSMFLSNIDIHLSY